MKFSLFFLCLAFLVTGCADEPRPTEATEGLVPDSVAKAKQFFPVLDYLRGEVKAANDAATAVKRIVSIDGKTDSGYIQMADFNKVMQEFLAPELSRENFEKYYSESSFYDETTQTSTFTYSTKNDELEFHRIDVLVKGTETYDKVSSVYMEKYNGNEDSSVMKKILVRGGLSVIINSETNVRNLRPVARQEKLIWNELGN